MHAAFDGETIVGGAGAFPFELTVPGGELGCAGVTVVGVMPTHRRRGVLRAMMRAQLEDVHGAASRSQRSGPPRRRSTAASATASPRSRGEIAIPREHVAVPQRRSSRAGTVRLVDRRGGAASGFPRSTSASARETPGHVRAHARRGGSCADSPTRPTGAAARARSDSRCSSSTARARATRSTGTAWRGRAARRRARSRCRGDGRRRRPRRASSGASCSTSTGWRRSRPSLLPVDHPLFLLLAEPRRMRYRIGDGLWVRLVDVGRRSPARTYPGDGAVVLEVSRRRSARGTTAAGTVSAGGAERDRGEPDLRLDVHGARRPSTSAASRSRELARARPGRGAPQGALDRADALFRHGRRSRGARRSSSHFLP